MSLHFAQRQVGIAIAPRHETVLAVAMRGQVPVQSFTVIEPPVPELRRYIGKHGHYVAFREMTDACCDAFQHGNNAMIGTMIDFYGGAGTFAG